MRRLRGLFVLDAAALELVFGPEELAEIGRHVDFVAPPQTRRSIARHPQVLADVEVLFCGWGAPRMDSEFLAHAGKLRTVFYAAGAIGSWVTDAVWQRGITISTASVANAIPVAEYTLAVILFSLKHGWLLSQQTRQQRCFPFRDAAPGNYRRTVGLVSMGIIARTLRNLLRAFDLHVIAHDPFLSAREADQLQVEAVTLEELFARSDVVSVHTPLLPETSGLITGKHLASLRQGATFINTARGELVREAELIEVARRRADLQFVLDVSAPEPPARSSPLYDLPNLVLTPHIAGSVGQECRRLGRYMVEELRRYVAGEPLRWVVTAEMAKYSSHRPLDLASLAGSAFPDYPPEAVLSA